MDTYNAPTRITHDQASMILKAMEKHYNTEFDTKSMDYKRIIEKAPNLLFATLGLEINKPGMETFTQLDKYFGKFLSSYENRFAAGSPCEDREINTRISVDIPKDLVDFAKDFMKLKETSNASEKHVFDVALLSFYNENPVDFIKVMAVKSPHFSSEETYHIAQEMPEIKARIIEHSKSLWLVEKINNPEIKDTMIDALNIIDKLTEQKSINRKNKL